MSQELEQKNISVGFPAGNAGFSGWLPAGLSPRATAGGVTNERFRSVAEDEPHTIYRDACHFPALDLLRHPEARHSRNPRGVCDRQQLVDVDALHDEIIADVLQRSSERARVCLTLCKYRRIEVVSLRDATPRRMTKMRRTRSRSLQLAISRRASTQPLPSAATNARDQHQSAKLLGKCFMAGCPRCRKQSRVFCE